jgi:hypothetical protein
MALGKALEGFGDTGLDLAKGSYVKAVVAALVVRKL